MKELSQCQPQSTVRRARDRPETKNDYLEIAARNRKMAQQQ
jgi:hypothetical protein